MINVILEYNGVDEQIFKIILLQNISFKEVLHD